MLALRDLAHPPFSPFWKREGAGRGGLKCPYTVGKIMNLMHTSKIKLDRTYIKNVFSLQILWRDLEALKNRAAVWNQNFICSPEAWQEVLLRLFLPLFMLLLAPMLLQVIPICCWFSCYWRPCSSPGLWCCWHPCYCKCFFCSRCSFCCWPNCYWRPCSFPVHALAVLLLVLLLLLELLLLSSLHHDIAAWCTGCCFSYLAHAGKVFQSLEGDPLHSHMSEKSFCPWSETF